MKLIRRGKWICMMIAMLACGRVVSAEGTSPRMSWEEPDHPSAVYHVKEAAKISVRVENPSATACIVKGSVAFGIRAGADEFKTLSVTPVTATEIAAGQSAKIPLTVIFGGAGAYEFRWIDGTPSDKGRPIENAAGMTLSCIFAPRLPTGTTCDARWLALLPKEAAKVPGYMPDLISQTGVGKYLLDERFAFDSATGIALGVGASLQVSAERVERLFADAAHARAEIILRITVPMAKGADARTIDAFRQYVTDGARRARGTFAAIIISPENSPTDRVTFRAFYLAGYAAAKGVDKNIAMLGAGNAELTRRFLLTDGDSLAQYLDAVAVTNVGDPISPAIQSLKLPVWLLPSEGAAPWTLVPPSVGLAEGAAVVIVPPPGVDRGVVEHLLGGAVVYQTLQATDKTLPYVATFQGDGFAAAVVAGLLAGTPLDAAWPQLVGTGTVVAPVSDDDKPAYPNLEVADDSGSMRVVDAAGAPVDCRQGDTLYVPAADKVVYLLSSGNAEDLIALLRSAKTNRFPFMEVQAKSTNNQGDVVVQMTNMSSAVIAGNLRIIVPTEKGQIVLAEQRFVPILPTMNLDKRLILNAALPKSGVIIAEVTTDGGVIQRTAIQVQRP